MSSKKGVTRTNGVVAGSVWETRMRMDQVKGGIKVFNGGDAPEEEEDSGNGSGGEVDGIKVYTRRISRNQSEGVGTTEKRKRRNWKQPEGPEKSPIQLRKILSEPVRSVKVVVENCRELGVEKAVVRSLSNAGEIKDWAPPPEDGGGEEEEEEEEIGVDVEKKSFDDKEVDLPKEKVEFLEEDKKIDQIYKVPISLNVGKKPPETTELPLPTPPIVPSFVKPRPIEVKDDFYESVSETQYTQYRMHSIVDLVMWRDISRSAFVFGIGTFLLISSSYTEDLNFSLISAISYMGLFYLAVIFLYKSILHRGVVEFDESNQRWLVGEEESIWLIKMLLPYINELLIKLRTLFSGHPATTMKMAILLFVLARCGGQITMWTMAKLAFFGVFTIPKLCSSYSSQLSRYCKFWVERCRDAWESCTHKKAAAAAVFTLIWNLSSTVARIWAVFLLVVTVRYYQQYCVVMAEPEWEGEVHDKVEVEQQQEKKKQQQRRGGGLSLQDSKGSGGGQVQRHRHRLGPSSKLQVLPKEKKRS